MSGYVLIDGEPYLVALVTDGAAKYRLAGTDAPSAVGDVVRDGDRIWVHLDGRAHELVWHDAVTYGGLAMSGSAEDVAKAPMPGAVVQVLVSEGAAVERGETMMIIESMKLETAIRAPRDGVVETVHIDAGQTFQRDAALVTLAA